MSASRAGEIGPDMTRSTAELNAALHAASIEGMHAYQEPFRCRYCGAPIPAGLVTDDPRSEECSDCLAEAHGGPENPGWSM